MLCFPKHLTKYHHQNHRLEPMNINAIWGTEVYSDCFLIRLCVWTKFKKFCVWSWRIRIWIKQSGSICKTGGAIICFVFPYLHFTTSLLLLPTCLSFGIVFGYLSASSNCCGVSGNGILPWNLQTSLLGHWHRWPYLWSHAVWWVWSIWLDGILPFYKVDREPYCRCCACSPVNPFGYSYLNHPITRNG